MSVPRPTRSRTRSWPTWCSAPRGSSAKLLRVHLQGSFALGDADLHNDVDFMVVTQDEVSALQESQLRAMHERLPDLDVTWAPHLEGSYVAKAALRRPDPRHPP